MKKEKKERNYARRYAHEFNWKRAFWQYWSSIFVLFPFFCLFYKLEIRGRKNVPEKGKFVVTANHLSYFDPFLTFLAVLKPTAFMAKKELFDDPKMCKWMNRLAAFSVNREKLGASTIKTIKDLQTTNWLLGIFPQGGIRKNHKIEDINKGFAFIAKTAKEDILPISITGCEEYNWVPFKGKIIVSVGTPISYELETEDIMHQWGEQIAKMSGYEYIKS